MIIDGHVHIWNFVVANVGSAPFTAESLIAHMDGPFELEGKSVRIDRALTQPRPEPDGNPGDAGHQYVKESISKYPDRLIGCAIINPMRNLEQSVNALERLKSDGFRAIKLHPAVHRYRPDVPSIRKQLLPKIFDAAVKLRMPILIHTGDPLLAEPSRMAPIIEDYSEHPVILCHLGTQDVSYAVEAIYVAKKNENVILESSAAGYPHERRLREAINAVGMDRIVLGTDCPISGIWSSVVSVYSLKNRDPLGIGLKQEDANKILGGNMARLLGLPKNS